MKTIIRQYFEEQSKESIIQEASQIILNGGLVAFPTETVYGLGANGLDPSSIKKIYEAKGRPSDNPLIMHISDLSQLDLLVEDMPPVSIKLANAFWPGPLTMIFQKMDIVPLEVSSGLQTIGIRYPANPVALHLIRECGIPIAAPSANSAGKPSPTKAIHVMQDLNEKIDMIIDGGTCEFGLESTIIDVTCTPPCLLRPGAITQEMIENVIGPIDIDPAILSNGNLDTTPKAPGMKYTHYSPNADVTIFSGEINRVVENIQTEAERNHDKKVGILCSDETAQLYNLSNCHVLSVGSHHDLDKVAFHLFDTLRQFDLLEVDVIYAEGFSENHMGFAVMNRLKKAAGYEIINV